MEVGVLRRGTGQLLDCWPHFVLGTAVATQWGNHNSLKRGKSSHCGSYEMQRTTSRRKRRDLGACKPLTSINPFQESQFLNHTTS